MVTDCKLSNDNVLYIFCLLKVCYKHKDNDSVANLICIRCPETVVVVTSHIWRAIFPSLCAAWTLIFNYDISMEQTYVLWNFAAAGLFVAELRADRPNINFSSDT